MLGLWLAAMLVGSTFPFSVTTLGPPSGASGRAASPTAAEAGRGSSPPRVQVLDDYFLPSVVEVEPGGGVTWNFTGGRTHTVTDATGMHLFDSGLVAPGGPSFSQAFAASGTYRYVCTLHETMRGRVWVVVEVSRPTRPRGRPFTIVWATGPAPEWFVYDVQLRRPGTPWRTWLSDRTDPSAVFVPKHAGTFRVRARLRNSASGATEWSPGTRFVAT